MSVQIGIRQTLNIDMDKLALGRGQLITSMVFLCSAITHPRPNSFGGPNTNATWFLPKAHCIDYLNECLMSLYRDDELIKKQSNRIPCADCFMSEQTQR